jgi:hypothetical protein
MSRVESRAVSVVLPLLLAACGLFDVTRVPASVEDVEAVRFAERIQGFYGALENVPIDSLMTYENRELRAYFENDRAFSDYYASLAGELRDADFRNGRAERVVIDEFRFEGPGEASVDLTLVGRHMRELRFWERKVRRTDRWRQVEGVWLVSPSKL